MINNYPRCLSTKFTIIVSITSLFFIFWIGIRPHFITKMDTIVFLTCKNSLDSRFYSFFFYLTKLSGEIFSVLAFFAIMAFLIKKSLYYRAFLTAAIFTISGTSGLFLKYFFKIQRPPNHIYGLSGYSFPSGHAVLATTIVFIVYFTIFDLIKHDFFKKILLLVMGLYLVLSFTSRVVLLTHWMTDIIGGFFVACFSLAISCYITKQLYQKTKSLRWHE